MEAILNAIGINDINLKGLFSPVIKFGQHLHDHFIPHHRNNYHPHILGHRALALFSALLITVKIFTIAALTFGPITPAFSSAINISNIISLTNESRQQFGIGTLTENSELDKAAQAKAEDMLAKGYFAHNTPDGKTPWDFIVSAGYSYLQAGENLAVNFSQAEDVETAWMNSPGHRANLLNKNFQEIGIGVSQGIYQDHMAIFVVQEFGDPAAQKVTLIDKPTQVQTTSVPEPIALKTPAPAAPVVQKASAVQSQSQPIPEIRGESQNKTAKTQVPDQAPAQVIPLNIDSGTVSLEGNAITFNAKVSGSAVKVLAYFGGQAIMLDPKENNLWQAKVPTSQLTSSSQTVRLSAFDMNGKSVNLQLADFAPNTISNYNLSGSQPQTTVNAFGLNFDPKNLENRFYLMFIAGLLTSLIIAIGVKRHIQHLPLIANSSFVVMFAALLFWMG